MPYDWTPKDKQYWSTLGARRSASTGQPAATGQSAEMAHQFVREVVEQDVMPAVDKWLASYKPWPTVVVASLVLTALGVTILAVKALGD